MELTSEHRAYLKPALLVAFLSLTVSCNVAPTQAVKGNSAPSAGMSNTIGPDHELNCEELNRLVGEDLHGLTAHVSRPPFAYDLTYRPKEIVACKSGGRSTATVREALAASSQLNGTDQYILRITGPSNEAVQMLLQGWGVLLSSTNGDPEGISQLVGTERMICSFAHVESGASLSPSTVVLLGFDVTQSGEDRSVVVEDPDNTMGGDLIFNFLPGVFSRYINMVAADDKH
jgi:hypothetical protein